MQYITKAVSILWCCRFVRKLDHMPVIMAATQGPQQHESPTCHLHAMIELLKRMLKSRQSTILFMMYPLKMSTASTSTKHHSARSWP
jgi:hypothetical protein